MSITEPLDRSRTAPSHAYGSTHSSSVSILISNHRDADYLYLCILLEYCLPVLLALESRYLCIEQGDRITCGEVLANTIAVPRKTLSMLAKFVEEEIARLRIELATIDEEIALLEKRYSVSSTVFIEMVRGRRGGFFPRVRSPML